MYAISEKIFYSLAATLLGAAFFVVQPAHNTDVMAFQNSIEHQFQVAIIQLWGDRPVNADAMVAINGINEFYQRSSDAAIALLAPAKSEQPMFAVLGVTYSDFKLALGKPQASSVVSSAQISQNNVQDNDFVVPVNFMQEPPVANIVPASLQKRQEALAKKQETIASANIASNAPAVNDLGNSWVNLRDNDTGQVYCVAIYNAEVNRYLGPCKDDYH